MFNIPSQFFLKHYIISQRLKHTQAEILKYVKNKNNAKYRNFRLEATIRSTTSYNGKYY